MSKLGPPLVAVEGRAEAESVCVREEERMVGVEGSALASAGEATRVRSPDEAVLVGDGGGLASAEVSTLGEGIGFEEEGPRFCWASETLISGCADPPLLVEGDDTAAPLCAAAAVFTPPALPMLFCASSGTAAPSALVLLSSLSPAAVGDPEEPDLSPFLSFSLSFLLFLPLDEDDSPCGELGRLLESREVKTERRVGASLCDVYLVR